MSRCRWKVDPKTPKPQHVSETEKMNILLVTTMPSYSILAVLNGEKVYVVKARILSSYPIDREQELK
jgi:hypothetical protein